MNKFLSIVTALLLATVSQASAQDPLQSRLADVCSLISGSNVKFDSVFTASFLKQVPAAQLTLGVKQITSNVGMCLGTKVVDRKSDFSADAIATTANGFTIPISISVESTAPFRIEGLFIKNPVKMAPTIDAVIADLATLPGGTSFFARNLSTGKVLGMRDTAAYLPIGSTFKLYILGELVRSVKAGERKWEDVARLDSMQYSLPSGVLQSWPHGSPITLHTLASKMISVSDNTATDGLHRILGARNVERIQSAMGHTDPSQNIPFLNTRQLFALKFSNGGERAYKYAAANSKQRQALLQEVDSKVELADITFVDTVMLPNKVEWFARTSDLVRAMDWFRSDGETFSQAREILAINPGVEVNKKQYTYVGYKGGSETGVINMTFLLRHRSGEWYALSVSWMRQDENCDLNRLVGIVQRAIELLAP